MKSILEIKLFLLKKIKTSLSDLNNLFPHAVPVEKLNELQDKLNGIKSKRDERWKIFRGKYEIEFLRVFLLKLQEYANQKKPKFFNEKRKVKFTLSQDNIISELSQYADIPYCLRNFLEQLKEKGIKK